MISNEIERAITASWAMGFEDAARELRTRGVGNADPILHRALCESYEGQAETLRDQLREYDDRTKALEEKQT